MNNSKIYYIINHYLDLTAKNGINDTEHKKGLYEAIKNDLKGKVYTHYNNKKNKKWLDYYTIKALSEKTKKEIDSFFYQ